MESFVRRDSIVRQIWSKGDTILFIFAGASAEFALNKAVDWLYFTGRLPSDPLGRLFSTVEYSRQIIFANYADAVRSIDKITAIHKGVERKRGANIPDSAYRDVLFMLIDYTIRSYEVLERKLTNEEKGEVFDVFNRVGIRMGISGLPRSYNEWIVLRGNHLGNNLAHSKFTKDLYKQYKRHLGVLRYLILKQSQILVVPERVKALLSLGKIPFMVPVLLVYKLLRIFDLQRIVKYAFIPPQYLQQVKELDQPG